MFPTTTELVAAHRHELMHQADVQRRHRGNQLPARRHRLGRAIERLLR